MSYLYEALEQYQKELYGLKIKEEQCQPNWLKMADQCQSQNQEMKKFIVRMRGFVRSQKKDFGTFPEPTKKFRLNWLEQVRSQRKGLSLVQRSFANWCKENNCRTIDNKNLQRGFKEICQRDQENFRAICNEQDSLFGIHQSSFLLDLIKNSSALTVVNEFGQGEACLNRFVQEYRNREKVPHYLLSYFEQVYKELKAKKEARYLQGNLFLPGSLKLFDVKGLESFLFKVKDLKQLFEPPPQTVVRVQPMLPAKKEKKVVKKVKKKNKAQKVSRAPKKVVEEVKLSPFETAVEVLKKTEGSVPVDMNEMKKYFRFKEASRRALYVHLKEFQTRKALLDLKTQDSFGGQDQPMRLIFLWYLIDQDQHQGLFNIKAVLGDRFFVVNDIEGKSEPIYTGLTYEKNSWKLTLLENPKL